MSTYWWVNIKRMKYEEDNFDCMHEETNLFYKGEYSDVVKLLRLQYRQYDIKITPIKLKYETNFMFLTPWNNLIITSVIDAKSDIAKKHIPRMAGDIINYKSKLYKVLGFNGTDMHIGEYGDNLITLCMPYECTLIFSRYWAENKR